LVNVQTKNIYEELVMKKQFKNGEESIVDVTVIKYHQRAYMIPLQVTLTIRSTKSVY